MKFITPYGFCDVKKENDNGTMLVELEEKFAGTNEHLLQHGEVFPFTKWATIRIINLTGKGYLSNLQFHLIADDAQKELFLPKPPDETVIFLNFTINTFKSNQPFSLGDDFIIMRPWIDRWAEERTNVFETYREATKAFEEELSLLHGAGGITSMILLDIQEKRVKAFALSVYPPQGVIFSAAFG